MTADLDARLDEAFDGDVPESVDDAALERLRTVAYILDESIRVPGTEFRVGLDPLLSAVPVVGDVLSGGLSLYIVAESAYLGVPFTTVVRMLGNIAVDVAGGSLPFVGTLFDAVWKTNKRNVDLLVSELESKAAADTADEPVTITIDVEEESKAVEE
ncbi:DUF4112 domain-containing protein [Halorientalis litorea]|uniref:DUF4112 domain-containing protein n=1 Tax=Halorientalis litorea TaxID=2931977 RepID=UPI001FF1CC30|nr:DUF4112 domain-containing protein [Halorientalis litorea]